MSYADYVRRLAESEAEQRFGNNSPTAATTEVIHVVDPTNPNYLLRDAYYGPDGTVYYQGPPPGATVVEGTTPPASAAAVLQGSVMPGSKSATGGTNFSSAAAIVSNFLREAGLEGETQWALDVLRTGISPDEVLLQLRERPAYKARFIANAQRKAAGLPQLSEGEIISYERTTRQLMRAAGLPPGFYDDPNDFANFLARDVSVTELQTRVQDGFMAASAAPPEVRDELHRLYGVDLGGLAAYFLDPDRALPVLQRQFASAQIGGASQRTGFGALNQAEAERLAALGVTADEAQQGFGELNTERELFGSLPGERGAATIGRDHQLAAEFGGDAAAAEAIRRRSRSRAAVFSGGGAFASGQGGVVGLGTAESA